MNGYNNIRFPAEVVLSHTAFISFGYALILFLTAISVRPFEKYVMRQSETLRLTGLYVGYVFVLFLFA
jgi:hypothetical protein